MVTDIAILSLAALVVGFTLHKSDDTNFQVAVLPVAVLLLLWLVPDGQRAMAGSGIALGTLAYLAMFLFERARSVPMPDYPVLSPAAAEGVPASPPVSGSPMGRTPAAPDGPYYIPNTPRKTRIAAPDTQGQQMNFAGRVLRRDGAPVEGACIEIWHADGNGDYDYGSYNTRGHQFTNANGEFLFETVKPLGYGRRSLSLIGTVDYRSAHIHAKIRIDGETLTTQVWFPEDPRNARDIAYWKFKNTNVVDYENDAPVLTARFDFVV